MKNKFDYILQLFLSTYKPRSPLPDITYGNAMPGLIHISQGETRCLELNEPIDIQPEKIIWKPWLGEQIPFFFDASDHELFIEQEGKWFIQFDIIASAFFLISGWQEYFSSNHDRYGRFRYSESVQHRFGFTHLPVVNYYFDILRTVIEKACHIKLVPVMQDPVSPYTVCLTHDIDTCETAWLEGSFSALKKKDLLTPVKLVLKKLFTRDAWFNFSEILALEKSFDAVSSFFFIPASKKKNGIKNADYDLKRARFKAVFSMIIAQGGEVGLHGSIGSSDDINLLKAEVSSFPFPVTGNRFHFLLYDVKKSLNIMEEARIEIDSSMGFAEHFGFRNSFCLPFRPYDISGNRAVNFYEIPLTLMDGTLQKYMNLSPEQSFDEVVKLTQEMKKFGGVMTVLWHNTHFSPYKYHGWKELYAKLLTRFRQDNACMESCAGVLKKFQHG
jgi:hypothetical protein